MNQLLTPVEILMQHFLQVSNKTLGKIDPRNNNSVSRFSRNGLDVPALFISYYANLKILLKNVIIKCPVQWHEHIYLPDFGLH